jgi:hypothetical protein
MKIKSIAIGIITLALAVDILGGYQYNRLISYIIILTCLFLIYLISKNSLLDFIKGIHIILPIIIYFLFLLIGSLWALYPAQTIYYVTTDLIFVIYSLIFVQFYRLLGTDGVHVICRNIVILSLLGTIVQLYFLRDLTRIGAGTPFLAVVIPFIINDSSLSKKKSFFLITSAVCILLISMSRTVIIVALVNYLLVIFLYEKRFREKLAKVFKLFLVLGFVILIVLAFPFTRIFLLKTIIRFAGIDLISGNDFLVVEETDLLRISLLQEANKLYPSYWFQGMGYMNFMQWFGENFNITYVSFDTKKEIIGSNLHNSFQSWALEGGVFCLLIVLIIFLKFYRLCYKDYMKNINKYFSILLISSLSSLLLFGFFHQLHQALVFYMILTFGFSLRSKSVSFN